MTTVIDINRLLESGESQIVEFKTSFGREAIETLVTFANAQGGAVLVGVADDALVKYVVNSRPTWAALLLFAEEPLRHHIHIGRFKTPTLIIDDRQITDSLFEAVDQAMQLILSHISVTFTFDGSLQRKERFAYPLPALREALLYDVVHRDYANSSDIQIKIFDDRITLFSPGKLYGGLSFADLSTDHYQSRLRNKLIAEAFYLTKNIEKFGSGFIRIRNELMTYPEIIFAVEEISGGVLVAFGQGGGVTGGVTGGVDEVLNYIRMKPGVKTSEIVALDLPQRTLERWLKRLKVEKKVSFKGAPKIGGYFATEGDQ